MQALRQIVDLKDNFLHVVLPTDFRAEKVDVIVLPINEHTKLKNSERFSGTISKETAEKFHKYLNAEDVKKVERRLHTEKEKALNLKQ